jgi:hypothetical protein
MNTKNLLIFAAIVGLFFGLFLIFAPEILAKIVLTHPEAGSGALATFRDYGILLLAVGIGSFIASNSMPSAARRGYVVQITISSLLFAAYNIYNVVSGICKSAGWGIVVITAILGIWGLMMIPRERTSLL